MALWSYAFALVGISHSRKSRHLQAAFLPPPKNLTSETDPAKFPPELGAKPSQPPLSHAGGRHSGSPQRPTREGKHRMLDLIGGRVLSVIDAGTFELQVFYQDPGNSFACYPTEQILIASIDLPEIEKEEGTARKLAVQARLLGRMVVCEVLSRDRQRRLVCCVHAKDQTEPPDPDPPTGPAKMHD